MPELSVVIPTYNRAGRLQACLTALAQQTQPFNDFEVVVVVDGSTDETMALLRDFDAPYLLRPIWQENTGQPGALNRGIAEANGRYCLFLDDDITASPQLVAAHLQVQRQQRQTIALGQITMTLPPEADWYTRAFTRGWEERYAHLNQGQVELTWEDGYSGNLSAPRDMLLACGGFATDLPRGYDVELAYRLEQAGGVFVYLPQAVGCQDERKGFRALTQDAENAGIVDVTLYQRDRQMLALALASFTAGSWRKLLLRRLLLAGYIPTPLLEWFGRFLKNPDHRYSWHSFIQNFCYWRGVKRVVGGTPLWSQLTAGMPILVYRADEPLAETVVPDQIPSHRLAAHIAWLQRLGYQIISLNQFLACQQERRLPPPRSVVLTFDGGHLNNETPTSSIWRQGQPPATIFLASAGLEQANQPDKSLPDWSDVEKMAAAGIQFGLLAHPADFSTAVSPTEVIDAIVEARERLEQKLAQPVAVMAYSVGKDTAAMQAIVEAAGFKAGCTREPGLNGLMTPLLALHRVEIRGTDSAVRLWLALWLGNSFRR